MIHFDEEITALKEKLLTMASKATGAVNKSIKSLVDRDDELARLVQHEDDELDRLEIEIDDIGIGLLAKAPLAGAPGSSPLPMKTPHDLSRWATRPRRSPGAQSN